MSEEQKAEDSGKGQDRKPEYTPPKGAVKQLSVKAGGRSLEYRAEADWIVLRKDEKPTAEMFYTYYSVEGDDGRPVTFVFNGGPGASSVYLHFGAIGPKRAEFGGGGEPLPPPHRLVDNDETWLRFTDLVFIDPIGTGLSRSTSATASRGFMSRSIAVSAARTALSEATGSTPGSVVVSRSLRA